MDAKTLREQIYTAALPLLRGRRVTDLVIGLSLLAVELDERDIAVSYVLRDDLKGGCSIFPYGAKAVGMSAKEAGLWFVNGGDDVQRAVGGAVLTAASRILNLKDCGGKDRPFDVELSAEDTVGMIGNIAPAAKQLRKSGCRMIIFDKGKCENGDAFEDISPMELQSELLPKCSAVFLSGTTTINGTAASLLKLCEKAREVVLLGSSVPMIPQGFADTNVSILAGSWWRHEDKAEIFRLISRAAGMQALSKYMIKKNVRIRG